MKNLIFILALALLFICSAKAALARTVQYTSADLRDPFLSPFEMQEPGPQPPVVGPKISHLQVQGLVWNSQLPQAIINDTVVIKGEVISGAEILEIRKEGVYVLYEGRQYILRPSISKKR